MTQLKSLDRLTAYLATFLTFCCPFEIAASKASLSHSYGQYVKQDLDCEIISTFNSKDSCLIKLSCSIPLQKEEAPVAKLMQCSLFQGTLNKDRQTIIHDLNNLGFDIDAHSNLQITDQEQSIQFCLSKNDEESRKELVSLIKEVTLSPNLTDKEVELARRALLEGLESEDEETAIKNVTASQVREYYKKWYTPQNMKLTIAGYESEEIIRKEISEVFQETIESIQISHTDGNSKEIDPIQEDILAADTIALATDNKTYVVDGKIWMDSPNWINTQRNGIKLGSFLSVVGLGAMFLIFPVAPGLALITGGTTFLTGLYFQFSSYLKDPTFVEKVRKEDLQKGCAHAYKQGRAGITLTPYERRSLFLKEMVDHPHLLPNLPILLLADLYQIHDPIIAQLFTVDEYNVLTYLKRDFIQQRNNYKTMKENLERELLAHLAPYARIRDNSLQNAHDHYGRSPFVAAEQSYLSERQHSLKEIEESYKKNEITLEQKNALIVNVENQFINSMNVEEFQHGLNAAKAALQQMQFEIQNIYSYHEEQCKQSIQYHQRKILLDMGHQATIDYFNQQLHDLLATFPVYLLALPDYLDLRGL